MRPNFSVITGRASACGRAVQQHNGSGAGGGGAIHCTHLPPAQSGMGTAGAGFPEAVEHLPPDRRLRRPDPGPGLLSLGPVTPVNLQLMQVQQSKVLCKHYILHNVICAITGQTSTKQSGVIH